MFAPVRNVSVVFAFDMGSPFYYGSRSRPLMRTLALMTVLVATSALADPPKFGSGGVQLSIAYGGGIWGISNPALAAQIGQSEADLFTNNLQGTHTLGVRFGYSILGHATIAVDLTATGWNIFSGQRGGAGFLTGVVAWHPLQLVWRNKEVRPVSLDIAPFFGVGYGIAGQVRASDGPVLTAGLNVDYFFTKWFGLGAFFKAFPTLWSAVYFDFDNKGLVGGRQLPNGVGGAFWHLGLQMDFRFGE